LSIPACSRITNHVTQISDDREFQRRMRALAGRSYSSAEVADLLCDFLPFEVAAELRTEYHELPSVMADLIVNSWKMADEAGMPWSFQSMPPAEPIAYARARRVRFTVDVDEDGVTLGVAHIAGRKAEWYQPALAGGAVAASD